MPTKDSTLLVIGSGPGIGRSVAVHFAKNHISHIALISRDSTRLATDAEEVRSVNSSVDIKTYAIDVADLPSLRSTLSSLNGFGTLECVFYNAARVRLSPLLEDPVEELDYDWKITNLALYETAKWAIPKLQSLAKSDTNATPSLIVTSSLLDRYPIPALYSLSMTKTAQRNLVTSLDKQFGRDGVHCALVSVGGRVDDGFQTVNRKVIAERVYALSQQKRGEWVFDQEVMEGI